MTLTAPETSTRLATLLELVRRLEEDGIRYVHWKTNVHISLALAGIDDLDLLVERGRFEEFVAHLCHLGFRPAETPTSRQQPGVCHYLGNDPETGRLINIHAYSRILSGDHFLKNWTWPVEEMLLENARVVSGVRVPEASAELVIFVLRALVKRSNWADRMLRVQKGPSGPKGWESEQAELAWILVDADIERSVQLCNRHLPGLEASTFRRVVELLQVRTAANEKELLGLARQVAARLGQYRRFGPWQTRVRTAGAITRMTWNRFGGRKHMRLSGGGAIVAFVGPQACGKSTLIGRLKSWLGAEVSVRQIHVGKPPATPITWVPKAVIPLARVLLPGRRTTKVEQELEQVDERQRSYSLLFLFRKVMHAWDRRALLRRAYAWSRSGEIVLCDRYPSELPGAVDGRSFTDAEIEHETSNLKRWLMTKERELYAQIALPDLVIQLSVPLDVALARNLERKKDLPQTQDYVAFRHAMRRQPSFERAPVLPFESTGDLDEFVREVQRAVWPRL